jgi:bifunctional non-homologous end joining protein LigD
VFQPRIRRLHPAVLASKAAAPPSGAGWVYEIKHDGFRVIARKAERLRLYSRPGNDLTRRFPLIVEAVTRLRCCSIVLDGEAVVCGEGGVSNFDLLRQGWHQESAFLYAFDLIELIARISGATPLDRKPPSLASSEGAQ